MADMEVGIGLVEDAEVKDLPPSIRLGFVKKVYGLVFYMLAITFAVSSPFVFAADKTMSWMSQNTWVPITCSVLFLGFYLFNVLMVGSAVCCRNPRLMHGYIRMFKTSPVNLVFLTCVSLVFGVMIGFVLLQYTAQSILAIFGMSGVLIAGLTAYAVKTKADFTGMGAYVLVLLMGLMVTGVLLAITSWPGSVAQKVYAGVGAVIFGFIIVYDTQMIFGQVAGGSRKFQYTVDAYAFAAFQLYLDYINFLLYMLQLLGSRR